MPLDALEVKAGLGRPRTNRRRDPYEDSKMLGELTRHGKEIMCRTCHKLGHDKRTYPTTTTTPK